LVNAASARQSYPGAGQSYGRGAGLGTFRTSSSRLTAAGFKTPVDRLANSKWTAPAPATLEPFYYSGFQVMNEHPLGGIAGIDPLRAIDLIWTLRDIKAKRTLLPPDPDHLHELIELGLVEIRDDGPALTNQGHAVLD